MDTHHSCTLQVPHHYTWSNLIFQTLQVPHHYTWSNLIFQLDAEKGKKINFTVPIDFLLSIWMIFFLKNDVFLSLTLYSFSVLFTNVVFQTLVITNKLYNLFLKNWRHQAGVSATVCYKFYMFISDAYWDWTQKP